MQSVPSDRLWLRSELMGTQVITRDSGKRLGVVGEVVVDIDRREVVALGLRDNPLTRFLPGLPKWMPLESIKQVGDVILVDSVDSLSENFSPDRFSKIINSQVVTESGQLLGRVLGFSFDIETGQLMTLVMGALGVPLLGEGVLSTWEIAVEEIVSSGADRIIVYEGAEEKLNQLNSGLLEKLGVGGSSWEERERNRYNVKLVPVENQLTSGEDSQENSRLLKSSEEELYPDETEMEYVELNEPIRNSNTKAMAFENEYEEELEFYDDEDLQTPSSKKEIIEKDIKTKVKNYRKASNARKNINQDEEPLDVEPLDLDQLNEDQQDKVIIKNRQSSSQLEEIEDPW
tara:strand:+ start:26188 stop:27222 length:1035 start_codon:yes stop_codon:yes gene_type:complete